MKQASAQTEAQTGAQTETQTGAQAEPKPGTQTDAQAASPANTEEAPQAERFAVGLIVNNHFGVLNRISGLYAKRCYNIDALSVGETADPRFSRMTIVSTGDEYMKDQVVRQLEKLIDVLSVTLLEPEETAFAQHMFIKIRLPEEGPAQQNQTTCPEHSAQQSQTTRPEHSAQQGQTGSSAYTAQQSQTGQSCKLANPERAAPACEAAHPEAGNALSGKDSSAENTRRYLLSLISRFRGRVIDFGAAHLTAELTGTAAEVETFIEAARPFGILELSRSGDIAIGLGLEHTLYVSQPSEG